MRRSRKEIEAQFPMIQEMYNSGRTIAEIAEAFNMSKTSVYSSFTIMGVSLNKRISDESKLTYAINNPPVLERLTINGKRYTDITPIFAPR